MIYEKMESDEGVSQGDIIHDCPILFWEFSSDEVDVQPHSETIKARVVVLTQACDLAQSKAERVLVAVVHDVDHLVKTGILKPKLVRDHVRLHRVYGWYFLPADSGMPESIVDLRDLHTCPRKILDRLIHQGKRICRIRTPYREHLGQHFSSTYTRIGLPEPYETQPED